MAPRPRDLGLLINFLIYRVPAEQELSEEWIEVARKHCRMSPERLAELRSPAHARHWPRIVERRAARLAYLRQHGTLPPRWKGLLPGERDWLAQVEGARRYRKGGLAKLKAAVRKRRTGTVTKLFNRYVSASRIRSSSRKAAALEDVGARIAAYIKAHLGDLTLPEFEALKSVMLGETAFHRRKRKQRELAAELTGSLAPGPGQKTQTGNLPR